MIGRVVFGLLDFGFAVLEAGARTAQRAGKLWRFVTRKPEAIPLRRRPQKPGS